jgi:hypothetical protein
VSKLNHEEPFPHLAYVQPIDLGLRVIGELGIINIDISQLAHPEVLTAEILQLD